MLEVMQILHISYKINNKESQLFTSFLTQTPSVLITLSLAQLEHWLQLLGVDIFRSAENVRFWDALRSWKKKHAIRLFQKSRITEFVDLHHSSESNQTDEGVLGYHRQRHDKVVLETLELFLVHASIDDEQKDGTGNRPLLRKRVLDRREVRN